MFTGSKKKLLDMTKRRGSIKVEEAKELTDLAKTTLREHFLQLERDGYLEREYVRSGPGRPSLQYQLTSKGNSLYPSYESNLMREFLQYLRNQNKQEIVEEFFEHFWQQRIEQARGKMGAHEKQGIKKQMEALMNMLEKEGFMPEFDLNEEDDSITVKECNCPFSEIVKETRLPCKLEAMFYSQIFGDQVERTAYIPDGDHSCSYKISGANS